MSARIASGTRSRSACLSAGRRGECSASRRSFFKSRHGLLVLGRMARTRADVREAELLEDLADRALVVSDAEGDCQESCVRGHSDADGGRLWRSRKTPWTSFWTAVTRK